MGHDWQPAYTRAHEAWKRKRERMRQEFPEVAKIVDEFRKHFGPGVKVKYAEENGRRVGND